MKNEFGVKSEDIQIGTRVKTVYGTTGVVERIDKSTIPYYVKHEESWRWYRIVHIKQILK
jgi:hypothetical protein